MKVSNAKDFKERKISDCLIMPFYQGEKSALMAAAADELAADLKPLLSLKDFKGSLKECCFVYLQGRKEKRLLLLGLGKKGEIDAESLRKAYAEAAKACQQKGLKNICVLLPDCEVKNKVLGVAEGIFLANYSFLRLKCHSIKESVFSLLEKMEFICVGREDFAAIEVAKVIAAGVHFTRDLVNNNADDTLPKMMAEAASEFSKLSPKVKVEIFDKKRLEKEKMGLLLAVNRGSAHEPFLISIHYNGNPKSKERHVLVGKGITYDTGGLSLKPSTSMDTMKSDMAGAGAVMGALHAIINLNLPVNITGVMPVTENAIGSRSYKPGDVYVGYSGKTVEVVNTDAEGRLILADALAYTVDKLQPASIIDLASLTGAVVVALGDDVAGFFANNDKLAEGLLASSRKTGETIWRLPLHKEYKALLKSEIGDIKNSTGRGAGPITAALFLEEFVDSKIPWAHLDIAGTSFIAKPRDYFSTLATGAGVRLLVDYFQTLAV